MLKLNDIVLLNSVKILLAWFNTMGPCLPQKSDWGNKFIRSFFAKSRSLWTCTAVLRFL